MLDVTRLAPSKMFRLKFKIFKYWQPCGSTVVKHSTHNINIKGLNPAAGNMGGGDKMAQKLLTNLT